MNDSYWAAFLSIGGIALALLVPVTMPIWIKLIKGWIKGWFRA